MWNIREREEFMTNLRFGVLLIGSIEFFLNEL